MAKFLGFSMTEVRLTTPARITERIMPGVVDIPEGGGYAPDERGDR